MAVQDTVDRLVARGLAPSTVRNSVLPQRAIFRRTVARSEVAENPTLGLSLPAVRGKRERVARPEEARALICALPAGDRAVFATALYAGLPAGSFRAFAGKTSTSRPGSSASSEASTRRRGRSSQRVAPAGAASRCKAAARRAPSPPPLAGHGRGWALLRRRRAGVRPGRGHSQGAGDLEAGRP